jgi:hypothetical protein
LLRLAVLVAFVACKAKEEPKPAPPPASEAAPAPSAFIPGHVIVKPKPGAAVTAELLARHGLVKMKDLSGGATLYRVEGLDGAASDARARTLAIVDALKSDPNVAFAEVDHVLTFQ